MSGHQPMILIMWRDLSFDAFVRFDAFVLKIMPHYWFLYDLPRTFLSNMRIWFSDSDSSISVCINYTENILQSINLIHYTPTGKHTHSVQHKQTKWCHLNSK